MCEETWFGGVCYERCISLVDHSEQIQEHYWCIEFWRFRILSRDIMKKLMNKGQNICGVFKKINPRGTREIIYKNYIIKKAQDRLHLRRSPHISMNKIKKKFTWNRV